MPNCYSFVMKSKLRGVRGDPDEGNLWRSQRIEYFDLVDPRRGRLAGRPQWARNGYLRGVDTRHGACNMEQIPLVCLHLEHTRAALMAQT